MKPMLHYARRAGIALTAAALALTACGAWAQAGYPNRPIRIIVPWPAGGGVDVVKVFPRGSRPHGKGDAQQPRDGSHPPLQTPPAIDRCLRSHGSLGRVGAPSTMTPSALATERSTDMATGKSCPSLGRLTTCTFPV